jgi:2,3-bisphosphoglycerate-independent phosphoglycerate mutase
MDIHKLTRDLHTKSTSKIVMLVADGLGGLPMTPGGPTELEAAKTPNLDGLAARGVQGASIPVLPGISPGSGPGAPGVVRLRPAEVRDRPRGVGGDGHRL